MRRESGEYAATGLACARMYAVVEEVARAWRSLLIWAGERASVGLEIVDYPPPTPLETLWERADLACVFMCGWPFWMARPRPIPVAAPIPCGARYAGRPIYFTDFIARRDRGYRRLDDSFGGRFGWTAERSHSGFNAPRHHLLPYYRQLKGALYNASIGPLVTPIEALQSVVSGRVDVAPMDSYALDLITRNEPERTMDIVVLDSTTSSPIPLLVASPGFDPEAVSRLTRAFQQAAESADARPLLNTLNLKGFSSVVVYDYAITDVWARDAIATGYLTPG